MDNLPYYIAKIIQTQVFQRLKTIKQLGITYITLPQADHNRFDHCIGTYDKAVQTLNALEMNTEGLEIPDLYRKAVEIAALLHDVGHGPFSHTWEKICSKQYDHEENARSCIDEIFKDSPLDWAEDRPYAIELIKGLVMGEHTCLRDQEYRFLFEVVHNKHCGVDVDKWDYLLRDFDHSKDIPTPQVDLDFEDVFLNARASDDRMHIEYRYCDFRKIYNIFDARTTFHIHLYQKPLNICMENIIKYIIEKCEDNLEQIDGLELRAIRSSDTNAFLKLNDDEVWRILRNLKAPKEFVDLVKCLENKNIDQITPKSKEEEISIPDYLKVDIKIAYAGEELNSENLQFYGNKADKPTFIQKKGFYTSVSYFKIMPPS